MIDPFLVLSIKYYFNILYFIKYLSLFLVYLQGSTKLAKFMLPLMVDRWSRFAISVSGPTINLFVYCRNYTVAVATRQSEALTFAEDSLLMVGHAGGVIRQPFKVSI